MPTVEELLRSHVTLEVECVDRLYLNGYVPTLATAGGLIGFLRDHLGKPIPSPAILGQVTSRFRDRVGAFAAAEGIPLIPFVHGERKDDRANDLRRERPVRGAVVFIGVAPGEGDDLLRPAEQGQGGGLALGEKQIEAFLARWLERLPMPLTGEDRQAGYDWKLSIWQMEVSLTQVFARPVQGREFFEEVIRDNLDLGRPDRVQLIFEKRLPAATPGSFRTRVIQQGVAPSLHIEYRSFNLKQYFKEGRALRTEGTFHNPTDFGVNKGLPSFAYLQQVGRHINRRLLEVERVSQNCGLSADSIQRVVQPTVNKDGHKAPGLRFGDPRVMALMLSLALFTHLINGFRNQDIRRSVAQLTQQPYSAGQASYDLRRLCRKGLLFRPPGTHRYVVTPYGWKVARFFARLDARVFRPALVALDPQSVAAPQPRLARALVKVDAEIDALVQAAFPLCKTA